MANDCGRVCSNDNGPSGAGPSLGVSIDLSNLHRPPTVPAHPPLPTFALAGDPFLQPVGPTQPLPSEATPIDFFEQIFDHALLQHIVQETNRYARVDKGKSEKDFVPLTVQELKALHLDGYSAAASY